MKNILIFPTFAFLIFFPLLASADLGPSSDTPYGVTINQNTGQCTGVNYKDTESFSSAWEVLKYGQVVALETAVGTCYLDQQNVYPESCCKILGLQYIATDIPAQRVIPQPYTVCANGYYEGHTASCTIGDPQRVTGNITRTCAYQGKQTLLVINRDEGTCSVGYDKASYVKQSRYVPGLTDGEITGYDNEPAINDECPALEPAIEPTHSYEINYGASGLPLVSYHGVSGNGKFCDVYGDQDNPRACCTQLGYTYVESAGQGLVSSIRKFLPWIFLALVFLIIVLVGILRLKTRSPRGVGKRAT